MSVRTDALPALSLLWDDLEQLTAGEGIGIAIADFGGYRTAADTAEILDYKANDYAAYARAARARGLVPIPITGPWEDGSSRPIAPYGQSWHDYGAARDFKVTRRPATMTQKDAELRVAALAESIGLESGASYGDRWHVQLPISLEEASAQWDAYVIAGGDSSSSSGAATTTALLAIVAVGVGAIVAIRYAKGLASWH